MLLLPWEFNLCEKEIQNICSGKRSLNSCTRYSNHRNLTYAKRKFKISVQATVTKFRVLATLTIGI